MNLKFKYGDKVEHIATGRKGVITGYGFRKMHTKIDGKEETREVTEYYLDGGYNPVPETLLRLIEKYRGKGRVNIGEFEWRVNLDTGLRYLTNFQQEHSKDIS